MSDNSPEQLPPPKCIWCGADWDDPMLDGWLGSAGCETCGYGAGATIEIEVHCSSCKRLVYKKVGLDVEL